jgi:hypothetical protein
MEFYIVVFLAGLTVGQWLGIWGLVNMLAEMLESLQE